VTLLAAVLACAVVTLVGLATQSADRGASAAVELRAHASAPVPRSPNTPTVADPTRAILAEMNRRLGTPRGVLFAARKRRAEILRLERRLAQLRAAERRRLAALQAAQLAAGLSAPYWYDPAAAAALTKGPASPAEKQWVDNGRGAWLEASGYARPPVNAPAAIKRVIAAGNMIARSPYVWGGGHGAWRDRGYDCSGSVSYALAAGGMLGSSLTSGQLMGWGAPGPGRWMTVWASPTHVFMVVAGLRFDTSGRAGDHATRWQLTARPANGFVARHYPGL
jgi:cell wall-associated NlpC family hydrolase